MENLTKGQLETIDRLYREKCEEVARLEKENRALKTRCRVLSDGMMCLFCPMVCENRTTEFRGGEQE